MTLEYSGLVGHVVFSIVCLQAVRPPSQILYRSRRPTWSGRPCWITPPGTRIEQTACRLRTAEDIRSISELVLFIMFLFENCHFKKTKNKHGPGCRLAKIPSNVTIVSRPSSLYS